MCRRAVALKHRVSLTSAHQLTQLPTSVTLPAETGLCTDATVVCSVSIDSLQSIIRVKEVKAMLIHSPASAIPPSTQGPKYPGVEIQDVTLNSG